MNRNELAACFQDTLRISVQLCGERPPNVTVYRENFRTSRKRPSHPKTEIVVEENTSFAAACAYRGLGKTAVMNFANPVYPGGGVANGAMAQEECLCRSSSLYLSLRTPEAGAEFYEYHKGWSNHFFSSRLIYSRDVLVFKSDDPFPKLLDQKDWFSVDVITCAAPYLAKRRYTNQTALKELFKERIKNIFEAALDCGVEVLILGAFGCGAFKNPPEVVAKAFHEVIDGNGYDTAFRKIVFAIKSTVRDERFMRCPNLTAFELEFAGGPKEMDKASYYEDIPAPPRIEMPSGRVLEGSRQVEPYFTWKRCNRYYKKQFSILGDSISTLEGIIPKGYRVFFGGENCERSGVKEMRDTWWGKVIDFFGGELLVNNSWSGSRVTRLPNRDAQFPSGCSNERTGGLHINSVEPDVVIIFLGMNDWFNHVATEYHIAPILLGDLTPADMEFKSAYCMMLDKIISRYSKAELWCCTMCETYMAANPSFRFPGVYKGDPLECYNEIIRYAARERRCKLIDLYSYQIPFDTIDGSHPTADGMKTLATMVIREVCGNEVNAFMNCANGRHEFRKAEEYMDGTKYVCRKCGHADYRRNQGRKDTDYNLVGQIVAGRYELVEPLGRGGYFCVYFAKGCLDKSYAVKVCKKDDPRMNDIVRTLLLQKLQLMMKFNHPAIPKIIDIHEDEKHIFIVREYIEGEVLSDFLSKNGALTAKETIALGIKLTDVLRYLHSFDPAYIYRDMKPGNVMITSTGGVTLIDFGSVMQYNPDATEDVNYLGTRGYAAPEQYGGKGRIDPRADIYGLGITLHYCVTGIDPTQPLYEARRIRAIDPALPKSLEYIIAKCIEINPDHRYQNCDELLRDLNRCESLTRLRGRFSLFKKRQ